MPLVRIDLPEHKPDSYLAALGDAVHAAMVSTLNVPQDDRFQIITQHPRAELIVDAQYLGISRSEACVLIQITLNSGRSLEQKKAFYRAVAERLQAAVGMRKEDVLINLVEVTKENWSFGNGEAQYAS